MILIPFQLQTEKSEREKFYDDLFYWCKIWSQKLQMGREENNNQRRELEKLRRENETLKRSLEQAEFFNLWFYDGAERGPTTEDRFGTTQSEEHPKK